MHSQTNLFPEIGEIAEQTDKTEQLETDGTSGATNEAHVDPEEKTVQEVESLCMNCEEQVRELSSFIKSR
jgi:zinc finger protein